jgi:hypothetical protein
VRNQEEFDKNEKENNEEQVDWKKLKLKAKM